MNLVDTNELINIYLHTSATLTIPLLALVGGASPRIYCPRLKEGATLPAISYFTRGGSSLPNTPKVASPSVQFDCWAANSIDAREVYRALYYALAALVSVAVTVSGTVYYITKVREESHGQDFVDNEIPNYFSVRSFFSITVKNIS